MEQIFQVELPEWEPKEINQASREKGTIRQVENIGVKLSVRLGKKVMPVGDISELSIGDVLEVEKKPGHKVEIFLDEKKVGIGEAILMDENFGIVISEID
ncbi:FliM/FliN family flagellar motor switch protein [Listeria ivanovii]|uniref:Putative flagellar motor switch protein fliY C-terminal part n=1 Tax=Listeria ivanovii (strain ATCC BAA-678 / PAM 55) TaxID=881621 RepID=G2ZCV6_LISIP|nr:FliM/FliN family flagellar motor switch protein [Listeria ivanovii]AHI55212.1 flagellar motor switch protein FliN [Listeria ivanovii WSLC3009]MBC1758638.1 flagellar motor switch protein FliN [Listeria ivanovii]MBK3913512.1 flagellar motor switch protein FliN [Listeria ivanovii subsp. ivanovii]MBK3920370.1 flagellar motor switch protein FliN [Listeria ivanovii subsp. ivanovii]MBK3925802.1 flagellar motor switch protein FliN [Listeria ivanovii subsp. ivanovii]